MSYATINIDKVTIILRNPECQCSCELKKSSNQEYEQPEQPNEKIIKDIISQLFTKN